MNSNDSVITACLSRPIAFHRIFARVAGGAASGLFLSQLWYWHDKGDDPHGWIYKTQADWEDETTLTRREQETARQALRQRGILDEVKRGTPAKLYYRLNVQALFAAIRALAGGTPTLPADDTATLPCKDGGNVHPCLSENANLECTKTPNMDGGNVPASLRENATHACAKTTDKPGVFRLTNTETTAQTTHRLRIDNNNTAPPQTAPALEAFVVVDANENESQTTHGNLALETRPQPAAPSALRMVDGGADTGLSRAGDVALATTPPPDHSRQRAALEAVGVKEPMLSRLSAAHTIEQITAHIKAWRANEYGKNAKVGGLISAIVKDWQPSQSPQSPRQTEEDRAKTRARQDQVARQEKDAQSAHARRAAAFEALDDDSRAEVLRRAHARLGGRAVGKEQHPVWAGAFQGAIRCIMAEDEAMRQ